MKSVQSDTNYYVSKYQNGVTEIFIIGNFEHISHLFLVFLLLTLYK